MITELQHVEKLLCRLAQHDGFTDELLDLANGERVTSHQHWNCLHRSWIKVVPSTSTVVYVTSTCDTQSSWSIKHPIAALLVSSYNVSLHTQVYSSCWPLVDRGSRSSAVEILLSSPSSTIATLASDRNPASAAEHRWSAGTAKRPFSMRDVDYFGQFYVKSTALKPNQIVRGHILLFLNQSCLHWTTECMLSAACWEKIVENKFYPKLPPITQCARTALSPCIALKENWSYRDETDCHFPKHNVQCKSECARLREETWQKEWRCIYHDAFQ